MRILSHRGLWHEQSERNTLSALKKSLEHGFGFESDLRDYKGRLVVSHDPANADSCPAALIFRLLHEYQDQYCFAINIKADGLGRMLIQELNRHKLNNYFCFDMSVPQMIEYVRDGIRFYTRKSEYEPGQPVLYNQAAGVWVDAFEDTGWITPELLRGYLKDGKEVCLVSPDLHAREPVEFWSFLKNNGLDCENIFLCTDMPEQAKEFFEES